MDISAEASNMQTRVYQVLDLFYGNWRAWMLGETSTGPLILRMSAVQYITILHPFFQSTSRCLIIAVLLLLCRTTSYCFLGKFEYSLSKFKLKINNWESNIKILETPGKNLHLKVPISGDTHQETIMHLVFYGVRSVNAKITGNDFCLQLSPNFT